MALTAIPVNRKTAKPISANRKSATPKRDTAKPQEKVTEIAEPIQNNMDTLHCEAGNHSWQRAKQRGRKPFNCPLHQPEKVVATNTVKKSTVKSNKHNSPIIKNSLLADAKSALDNPRCSDEDRRAMKYIVTQISDGKRTDSLDHLTDRLKELIRRVNKRS